MNKKSEFVRNQLQYLLLQLEVNQLNSLLEFSSEILLFFAKYSFLFENSSDSINSCTADTSQFLMPQAFRERPVMYTDPNGLFYYDGNGQQKSSSSASSGENPSGAPDGTTQGTSQSPNTSALPRDVGQTNNNLSDNKDNSNGAFFLDPDSNPMIPYYQNSIELQALNDLTMILKDGKLIIDNNSCFRLNACNLMSYLFIVQDYTGYNFSLSEIASIITYGQETTNPSKTSEMSLLNNYDVRNPDVIMNKALEITGHPELTATAGHNIGDLPCRTYTNIKVQTDLGNEHRVVGDFEGNVIYNPWKNGGISETKTVVKVYVHGVMKK